MKKQPITHLMIDNSSSNEEFNGGCDYCLVPMTAGYVSCLLDKMDEVGRLHKADMLVYGLELWDGSPAYIRSSDKLQELRDAGGNLVANISLGEPILLTAGPEFREADFARVECLTVQVSRNEVWWAAYVKHTSVRIESAHVQRKTLLRILRSAGGRWQRRAKAIPPAIRRIHDLLYLDMEKGREFYNPDKGWDADTMERIAEIVAQFIPRPKEG